MSNCHCLPPEICDHIVDFLHDDRETLKQCSLVSKSWVSRTRKHLFAVVKFPTPDHLEVWEKTFPGPSDSPAHHTRTLSIGCLKAVFAAAADKGGWISTFSHVACLEVVSYDSYDPGFDFTPFYKSKISSTLKTLHVAATIFRPSQVMNIIYHFPLLEDLTLLGYDRERHGPYTTDSSPTSPALTGTLELGLFPWIGRILHRLLDLPNGLHFRKLKLTLVDPGDLVSAGKLVEACSGTLESLNIRRKNRSGRTPFPVDLSKATKFKDIVFGCGFQDIKWVTMALETATRLRDLQRISIYVPPVLDYAIFQGREVLWMQDELARTLWSDVDPLLVQFWESRSIRTKILYPPPEPDDPNTDNDVRGVAEWPDYLLPESMKRGIIDLVQEPSDSR